jgi:nodulation protein E
LRRVAVTGIGVISALGPDRESFATSLAAGTSGIRPMQLVEPGIVRFANAAEALGYRAEDHFEEKDTLFLDRFAQFAAVAAREAIHDAALQWSASLRAQTAIVTGTSAGGQTSQDENMRDLYERKQTRFSPFVIPKIMSNAGASRISFEQGVSGPVYTVSTACASATHSIGQAFWMVRSGAVECAIAGGSDAPFSSGMLKAWEGMRVVSPDTCRPFSRDRKGLILGEGAAMLVLEPLEHAQARGARIYGEIAGLGMSSDAHHITQPLSEGASRAMAAALNDAHVAPEQIGYINAHGTGTPANDLTETAAIRSVFGAHASRLMVSSTKSMHGHALGAAGAIEAAATLVALSRGVIPPTANYLGRDPACDLDVVPNISRAATVEWALSNSFAFGGLNAVLAFRRL